MGSAVSGIDNACERLPAVQAWSGRAHDAAGGEMFGRADAAAQRFSEYASAVAAALSGGAESIGSARTILLAKADELDAARST